MPPLPPVGIWGKPDFSSLSTYSQNPESLYLLEPEEDLRGPFRVIKIIKDRPLNGRWLGKTTKAGDLFGLDATECFFTKTEPKGTFQTKNQVRLLGGGISEGRRPSFQAPVCCPTGVYRPVFQDCSCRMLSGFQAEGRTRLPGGLINSLMAGASFPTVPEKWNVLRSSWSNSQVKLILFSGQQAWHWQNSARFGLETMPPIWPAWIMLWLLSMTP